MGQALYWLESTIASVLFVALMYAILVSIRYGERTGLNRVLVEAAGVLLKIVCVVLFGLVWLSWLATIAIFVGLEINMGGARVPAIFSSLAGLAFVVASIVVIKRGRKRDELTNIRAAATWRLGRLTLAWAVAFVMTGSTFWLLDRLVCLEMAQLRNETRILAQAISPPRPSDSQNAALVYHQAWIILEAQENGGVGSTAPSDFFAPQVISAIPRGEAEAIEKQQIEKMAKRRMQIDAWMPSRVREFDPTDSAMLEFLEQHEPVIQHLGRAALLTGCDFKHYSTLSPESLSELPSEKLRFFAKMLCLASCVAAHQGDMVTAMDHLDTVLALSRHCVVAELTVISMLVSVAIDALAFDTFQYILNQDGLDEFSISVIRLPRTLGFHPLLYKVMLGERVFGLSNMAATTINPSPIKEGIIGALGASSFRVFLWNADIESYQHWMRRYGLLAAEPFHVQLQRKQDWGAPSEKREGVMTNMLLLPGNANLMKFAAAAEARRGLIAIGIAMMKYRLDQTTYPDDFGQLVPKYLVGIPLDPCSGEPFKMVKNNGRITIYSVGLNQRDDGGEETADYSIRQSDDSVADDIALTLPE